MSDGSGSPEDVLAAYRDLGCAWVALTDHDQVTAATVAGVVAIRGCERTIIPTQDGRGHMLLYGLAAVPTSSAMRENASAAAFSSLAHPGWQLSWGKWTVTEALDSRVRAIEVYNGFQGGVWIDALWDACLTQGAAPFCTVGDDMHSLSGAGHVGAYAMVYADSCTSASILGSLADGRYYCTLGPQLGIAADGTRLTVSSPDVCDWQFIGRGGQLLEYVAGQQSATYTYTGTESYVRCRAVRVSDGKAAWTNPTFFANWQASVVINDGSGWTSSPLAKLSLDATSDLAPVVDLRLARDAGPWSDWRAYSATIDYSLPSGDGSTTLRVQFRDELGTASDGPPVTVILDTERPQVNQLVSPTHPDPARWFSNSDPVFSWAAADSSGIKGYSYALDHSPGSVPDKLIDSTEAGVSFAGKADGRWYFHVRACDVAGNWSKISTVPILIDTRGPRTVAQGRVRAHRGRWARLRYILSDDLSTKLNVTIVVSRMGRNALAVPRGKQVTGSHRWRFRCRLAKGKYRYAIRARDEAGNPQRPLGRSTLTIY
jgi:hypothetical protein